MTFEEFEKYQQSLFDEVAKMRDTKGREYANSADRFANFNRLAEELGLSNVQVAWVYTAKHLDSLKQYIRTQQTYSTEPIEGRIVDAICYLTLIGGMLLEGRTKEAAAGQMDPLGQLKGYSNYLKQGKVGKGL